MSPQNSDNSPAITTHAPTVIQLDTSKHASLIVNCALVCGICVALAVVCAGIAWWAITENRVTQSKYENLKTRVGILEGLQERKDAVQ
jgi:hypothetical protein